MNSLEQELQETRERLRVTIDEYETALEELKSSNEELQSVIEELGTVNHELAARVDELERSSPDLRNLFEGTQIAAVFLDRFMIIRSYTPAVTSIFNLIASDRGRPITDIANQLEGVDLQADIHEAFEERRMLERTVRLRNGKACHLMRVLPYRTAGDEIDGVLITFVDVAAVVADAEEQRRVLVAELNHRVRNMLQVVIGLSNQTLHSSENLQQFEKSFMGRMQALARAYELLSRDGWQNVSISVLLRSQLSPFASEGSHYTVEGDGLELTPSAALAMGMVLYELAMNAVKYGALSVPGGRLHISWQTNGAGESGKDLVFHWRESGGPTVHAPARRGFGSELMQRQLSYELNGQAAMEFREDGLRVTLRLPTAGAVVNRDDGTGTGQRPS